MKEKNMERRREVIALHLLLLLQFQRRLERVVERAREGAELRETRLGRGERRLHANGGQTTIALCQEKRQKENNREQERKR